MLNPDPVPVLDPVLDPDLNPSKYNAEKKVFGHKFEN